MNIAIIPLTHDRIYNSPLHYILVLTNKLKLNTILLYYKNIYVKQNTKVHTKQLFSIRSLLKNPRSQMNTDVKFGLDTPKKKRKLVCGSMF